MATVDELNGLLQRLTDAGEELRKSTADAHAARKDLHREVASYRGEVRDTIDKAVATAMDAMRDEIRSDMEALITDEIDRIATAWRKALHL